MGEDEADALAYSPAGFIWDNALRARHEPAQLRRVHGARGAAGATRGARARPTSWPATATWKGESDEAVFASEPTIESIRPVLAHRIRRLGDGRARPVPGRFIHQGARASSRRGASSRSSPSSACPTTTRAARAPAPPRPRRPWPTTTSPSAGSSRRLSHSPLLAGDGDLRHRGRPAGRLGPRERLPHHGLRGEPLREARRGGRAPSTTPRASCARSSRSSACRP